MNRPTLALLAGLATGCASYESKLEQFSGAGLCAERMHLERALVDFGSRRAFEYPVRIPGKIAQVDAELAKRGLECRTTTILTEAETSSR